MQKRPATDHFPSLFSKTAPLDVIETKNTRGKIISILPVEDMRAHFKSAINIISEIEENASFGRTTQSMAIALYPALEGLFDGIVTWCTLQNIETYAERLPDIHPAVNVNASTLHQIILVGGLMRDEMFGNNAPFPNIMGIPKNHNPYDNLIKPLKASGALDITSEQAEALGVSMQNLLDLSYVGRGSVNHHTFPTGRKFIQTWDDVDEHTFIDFAVPTMRAIVSTTVSAVKRNKNLTIPKAWLPRIETTPTENFDRTNAVKYVSSIIDSIVGNQEQYDRFILDLIEYRPDDDTPIF